MTRIAHFHWNSCTKYWQLFNFDFHSVHSPDWETWWERDDLEIRSLFSNSDSIWEKWLKWLNKCSNGQWLVCKGHWMFAVMHPLWIDTFHRSGSTHKQISWHGSSGSLRSCREHIPDKEKRTYFHIQYSFPYEIVFGGSDTFLFLVHFLSKLTPPVIQYVQKVGSLSWIIYEFLWRQKKFQCIFCLSSNTMYAQIVRYCRIVATQIKVMNKIKTSFVL